LADYRAVVCQQYCFCHLCHLALGCFVPLRLEVLNGNSDTGKIVFGGHWDAEFRVPFACATGFNSAAGTACRARAKATGQGCPGVVTSDCRRGTDCRGRFIVSAAILFA
jgi:hypothetical protein